MKKIISMPGFMNLSDQAKMDVLNLEDNFIGVGKATNASRGAKSWSEWKGNPKYGEIADDTRAQMIELEKNAYDVLQRTIKERMRQ